MSDISYNGQHILKFENLSILDQAAKSYDSLLIDIKFCIFRLVASDENTVYDKIIGYEYFNIAYEIDKCSISIFYEDKSSKKRTFLFTATTSDNDCFERLISTLRQMAMGYYKFEFDFDSSLSIWEQTKNEHLTFEEFFNSDIIPNISFEATYIEYNNFEGVIEYDDAKIVLSIQNDGFNTNYDELKVSDDENKEIIFEINLLNTEPPEKIHTTMKLFSLRYELYLNLESMSVFIGDVHNFIQFKFSSKDMAQTLFNILAILENTNENLNLIDIPITY